MSEYTRAQILKNRRKWIDFLKLPTTEKAKGFLESPKNNSARCCLGHACHVLIPETRNIMDGKIWYGNDRSYAPISLQKKLGLHGYTGSLSPYSTETIKIGAYERDNLASLNDSTEVTPQEIGAYLETVIKGGKDTPFLPLSDYPE